MLINSQSEALYFDGPTDDYLKVPSGETSRDLLAMVRHGLRARLNSAIRAARQSDAVARDRAAIMRGGKTIGVTVEVHPVTLDGSRLFLVTFADQPDTATSPAPNAPEGTVNHQPEQELETTRADLRNTIRDYE